MSTLRVVCVVALCFVAVASAAGDYLTCPTYTGKAAYNFTGCSTAVSCFSTFCSCLGGTASNGVCSGWSGTNTCAKGYSCMNALQVCMGTATSDSSCKTPLADLQASLVQVTTGLQMWNASDAYKNCRNYACNIYNKTTTGTCTSMDSYTYACDAIVVVTYKGALTLGGNWMGITNNTANKAAAIACLSSDLTTHLGYKTVVTDLVYVSTTSTVVYFTVDAAKALIETALASAVGNTNWMKCLSASKFTSLGGTGTITVAAADPTPIPAGGPTGPTGPVETPTPASASFAWSVAQALLAVIAVMIIA